MATIFRNDKIEFAEEPNRIDNFRLLTSTPRFASIVKQKNLFFDLRILNPGQFSFPYHFHRHGEELMMIISGSMTVRTPKGLEILNKGDLVFFELGETGAHQFHNHSTEPCTYLDVRTFINSDVAEYPDTGKMFIAPPGVIFKKDSQVGYFEGEEKIKEKWEELRNKEE
jgi:uncharacterized cupin superfamily protein